MPSLHRTFAALLALLPLPAATSLAQAKPFDSGWTFHLGEASGAERSDFADDITWQRVDLPHDWAIHAPMLSSNPSGGAGGFVTMGVGWYRKHLRLIPQKGQRYAVRFDGVMANSDVWINGHLLGHRPSGYVTFEYDLTPYLRAGDNLIAVRADNSQQPSSRFYQGAGIYRHVHLIQTGPTHLVSDGISVTTSEVRPQGARVNINIEVRNNSASAVVTQARLRLIAPSGRPIATQTLTRLHVPANSTIPATTSFTVTNPALWSPETPGLYRIETQIIIAGRTTDQRSTVFGIRDAHFEAATGFWLNGANIKIKGVALHSDGGAFGMAVPESVLLHRLLALKAMGANAVRTAHNAPSPELLDLCDRLGLLVMEEFFDQWNGAKVKYDFHLYFHDWWQTDLRDLVRRDRNHPSIILWSAGNEIRDTAHAEDARNTLAAIVAEFHRNDPSRPVTQALFRPNTTHDYTNGLADLLDVVGQNYRPSEILAAHADKPTRKIVGTENIHDRDTWLAVRDHPEYSGMFLWSGADYLGESRAWPRFADTEGMLDRTDYPKPDALERASWWRSGQVIYIARRVAPTETAPTDPGWQQEAYLPSQVQFPDWTPQDHTTISPSATRPNENAIPEKQLHNETVEVYSNCGVTELMLNGKSLGTQTLHPDASPRTWTVPYSPGTLRAQCIDHPEVSRELRTAGRPARILLQDETPTTAHEGNIHILRAIIVDKDNIPVPGARIPITFSPGKGAEILAVDDASAIYTNPFANRTRTTQDGRLTVYLRLTASSVAPYLTATSPGLPLDFAAIPTLRK